MTKQAVLASSPGILICDSQDSLDLISASRIWDSLDFQDLISRMGLSAVGFAVLDLCMGPGFSTRDSQVVSALKPNGRLNEAHGLLDGVHNLFKSNLMNNAE